MSAPGTRDSFAVMNIGIRWDPTWRVPIRLRALRVNVYPDVTDEGMLLSQERTHSYSPFPNYLALERMTE